MNSYNPSMLSPNINYFLRSRSNLNNYFDIPNSGNPLFSQRGENSMFMFNYSQGAQMTPFLNPRFSENMNFDFNQLN